MSKRNPRRVVADMLKRLGRDRQFLAKVWSQPQTKYDPGAEDAKLGFGGGWRPLQDAEKVENQAERWLELYRIADRMAKEAGEIRNLAAIRWHELERERENNENVPSP